jgi:hypothetical protein
MQPRAAPPELAICQLGKLGKSRDPEISPVPSPLEDWGGTRDGKLAPEFFPELKSISRKRGAEIGGLPTAGSTWARGDRRTKND